MNITSKLQTSVPNPKHKVILRGLRYLFESTAALMVGSVFSDLITEADGKIDVNLILWKVGIMGVCSFGKIIVETIGVMIGVNPTELKTE